MKVVAKLGRLERGEDSSEVVAQTIAASTAQAVPAVDASGPTRSWGKRASTNTKAVSAIAVTTFEC
ncbi:MAG: hypothetical protein CMQ24_07330 [Gammaproteobacteria bacterium]|nr:hypothetical protein [Gammaproteobacteria bacterium]